jgi:hypothetical protein
LLAAAYSWLSNAFEGRETRGCPVNLAHAGRSTRRYLRSISLVTLVAFFFANIGCTAWRASPITRVQIGEEELVNQRVRFHLKPGAAALSPDSAVVEMVVKQIGFPVIRGIQDPDGRTELVSRNDREFRRVSVDLNNVAELEVWNVEGWHLAPITQVRVDADDLLRKRARFYLRPDAASYEINKGVVEMIVREIEFPIVRGNQSRPKRAERTYTSGSREPVPVDTVSVDLHDVSGLDVQHTDKSRTCFAAIGIYAAIVGIVVIATSGSSSESSSGSCPMVYVEGEDGYRIAGEAYAGAIFRSIERTDMLPLPGLPSGRASLVLANEARETQYTDLTELVVADHAPGTRAVSTRDQEIILVSDTAPLLRATAFRDEDVTRQLGRSDEDVWQTDLSQFVDTETPPVKESVVATFPRPRAGERPVLELVLSNTSFSELAFAHFFGLMGEDFGTYIEQGNRADSGPRIARWREREGVDLLVEWKRGETWEEIATVTSVGPVAMRRVAVPLPPAQNDEADFITVRVTGGIGFWRFDEMGLSAAREGALKIQHIAPIIARNDQGEDERGVLTSVDSRYQILEKMNERLQLEFVVTRAPAHRVRSAFLYTRGYYNLHPPVQGERSPITLQRIRQEEGAFARFGLDLYRKYYGSAVARGASPVSTTKERGSR